MTLRSPVVALLWENWQLTRIEAAQRVVQGVVVPALVLAAVGAFGPVGNAVVRFAFLLLVMTHMPLWLSVAKLNGGRFMDGYRPGYPYYVLYTRPIRTSVLVGAPMVYLAATGMAAYILSALVLRAIFGYPFPLVPFAALIAAFHIAQWAAQWATSSKVMQMVGSIVASLVIGGLGLWRTREWPVRFDLGVGDYALLAAIGIASIGLTVAGVARQRRGDARRATARTVTRSGPSEWLAGLFQFRCPTASAMRAQVWFDLKSSGLPVLAVGLALAILISLSFEVTTRIDVVLGGALTRVAAVAVAMFSLPVVLLFAGNAFGIRARQGHSYISVFEATQAYGTARMAGLKVLVRSVCLLAALLTVGMSIWTSVSEVPFDVLDDNDTFIEKSRSPLSGWMRGIRDSVGAMSPYELLALAVVTVGAVAVLVTVRAALPALKARYPRRVTEAIWLVLISAAMLVVLTLATQRGIGSEFLLNAVLKAVTWIGALASMLATVYLCGTTLKERLLTLRQAGGALLVTAIFGMAWLTLLRATGVSLGGMPVTYAVGILSLALMPLLVSVLAPWSLSRIRHS